MRTLITAAFILFLLLFGSYMALELLPAVTFGGPEKVQLVTEEFKKIADQAWSFARPLL